MAKNEERPKPHSGATGYWATLTIVGIALTVTINAAHAKGALNAHGTWTSALVAAAPPLMFAALWEGYFLARRSVSPGVLRLVTAAVVLLGGAAFAVSYVSIAQFLNGDPLSLPRWAGWVMPAMFDVFVAVSAYVLHILLKHGAQPASTARSSRNPSRLRRLADAATARVEVALETPPKPLVSPDTEARGGFADGFTKAAAEACAPSAATSTEVLAEVPADARGGAAKASADAALAPWLPAARWMEAERVVARKTTADFARIIDGIERGLSTNAVKTELGYSAGTVDRVRGAWHRWNQREPHLPAAGHDRQLTAV